MNCQPLLQSARRVKYQRQVALETVVGSQGPDVALILGVEAVEADLTTLLVKVLSHQSSKIENL